MALLAAAAMVLVAVRIPARQPTPPVPDAGAVTLYQRALLYLQNGRDGLPEARELLRAAVSRDSGYAPALARLAEVQARMNWYGYDRDAARMAEARALIDRSAALAPRLAERHLELAHWLLADRRAYVQAARQLDSALLLAGDNVDALMTRANIGRRLGRWSVAADDYARAARLDPGGYAIHLEQGNTLLLMRRYREARGALERARLLAPIAVDPVVWLAAMEVRERWDTAAARRRLEEGLSRDPAAFAAHRMLAEVRLAQGRPREAVARGRAALLYMPFATDAHAAMQLLAVLAHGQAAAGERDSARVHLGQLLAQPSVLTPAVVASDPVWRGLGPGVSGAVGGAE